jgi:hypothetical protein
VDVIGLFMALLSFRGISTPSLQAQGEQRRSSYFNNDRDIAESRASMTFQSKRSPGAILAARCAEVVAVGHG